MFEEGPFTLLDVHEKLTVQSDFLVREKRVFIQVDTGAAEKDPCEMN